MIRLKQSMGNVIKCKIDTEDMISKYECSVLQDNRLNGLLNMQIDKNSTIVYSDDVKKNLAEVLAGSIEEEKVNDYLRQIARVILDVKKMGLNPEKLILNPEWVYLTKDERVLKFIYCPVNGMNGRYDGILFMKDVLLLAPLDKDARDRWKQWLEGVTKTGITEQAVGNIGKKTRSINHCDVDEERETDNEEDNKWSFKYPEIEEEPMTGIEDDGYFWEIPSDCYAGEENENFNYGYTGNTLIEEDIENGQIYTEAEEFEDGEAPTGLEEFEDGEAPTGLEEASGYGSTMVSESFNYKPSLVRTNTGEKVVITSDDFKLGRSEQRADFCIRNNSGISNVHATIIIKNGQYFLKDNYSTNGTYVDGKRISDSSTPVLLRDGSVIQLYNEEIVFKY